MLQVYGVGGEITSLSRGFFFRFLVYYNMNHGKKKKMRGGVFMSLIEVVDIMQLRKWS